MKPQPIDGKVYYDGGLGEGAGIPLRLAERSGCERTVLVATRPAGYQKKPLGSGACKIMTRLFGAHPHLLEAVLTRNERYNQELKYVERREADGAVLVVRPDSMPVSDGTLNSTKLEAAYQQGYAQALRELPRLREYLGL
jgi:predicted patatin/cPLA2 family phospholipase